MGFLTSWLDRTTARKPDMVIGAGAPEGAYMLRWWIIPRNRVFNIYLHKFLRSDEDFALHDHPWLFNASVILRGQYKEQEILAGGVMTRTLRVAGSWKFRWGRAPHRVELLPSACGESWPCWTIFITGPVVRKWGFHCPKGWVAFDKIVTYDEVKGTSTPKKACP